MVQRLQIRYKLLAVLLIPLTALTVLTFVHVGGDVASGRRAARVGNLADFAGRVTAVVHDLQGERDSSLGYVAGGRESGAEDVEAQREKSDRSIAAFRSDLRHTDLGGGDPGLRQRLGDAGKLLDHLDDQRRSVDSSDPAGVARTQVYYGNVIAALLDFNSGIASGSDDRQTTRSASTFVLLSRLKELASRERGLVYAALSADRFPPGQFQQLVAVIGMQDLQAAQFQTSASRDQRDLYTAQVVSANLNKLANLRRAVLSAGAFGQVRAGGTSGAEEISSAQQILTEQVNRLRKVELRLGGEVAASSRERQSAARRSALVGSLLMLLVLALAVAAALLTGRSMARPLLRLRDVANQVAARQLPEAVERLQRGEISHQEAAAAPVAAAPSDETGQVAQALDAVHQVAVRVVGEQVALRMSIGEMFLNLARRSQDLVDRQLRLIDHLEKDAEPEALEQLFKLDHLATRMRRYAESLIVLAGAEPPRRWSQPVLLVEIVRASMSEVQDYQRVELLPFSDVGVSGHAVADVAHLLAELIENATSFSPPGTAVQITGHEAPDDFMLEIEDRGLGMSDEELEEANERLSNPPEISPGLSGTLGLYVVGRLARRHGINVRLRHSWYGGVTAMVQLPDDLTTWIRRREIAPPEDAESPDPPNDPPIFEQDRSQWFDAASEAATDVEAAADTKAEAPVEPPVEPPVPAPTPPVPTPPVPTPTPPVPTPPVPTPPPPVPTPPVPTPPPPVPTPPVPPPTTPRPRSDHGGMTHTGLPRRVPRANLAPGIVAQQAKAASQAEARSSTLSSRSPEEIRSMLSSYRSGLERGRRTATGSQEAGGHTGQNGSGGGGPMAPRSDDAAQ